MSSLAKEEIFNGEQTAFRVGLFKKAAKRRAENIHHAKEERECDSRSGRSSCSSCFGNGKVGKSLLDRELL